MENIKNLKKEKVEWKKLEEVCKFQNGFAFPSNLFSSTGIPVIKINNVSDGKVKFDNYKCFESETLGINLEEYKILPNDILITMTGTTKIGYNYSENIGYLNQRVGKIIPFPEKIKNRFLFHLLLFFENKIYKLATGAGPRPNLSAEQIKSFKVPLPPLKKQAKIAAALDKFTELTEELTEELTAREAQYDYYRNMLLSQEWIEREEGKEIEWKALEEVCKILNSKRKPITRKNRIEGTYPYYGANGIKSFVKDYIFNETLILMGEDGSVMDKNKNPVLHWIENQKIWVNNHAHVLGQLKKKYNLKYIYYFLSTIDVSKIVKGLPPKLNQSNLRKIKIPFPSLKTQQKIVNILDSFETLVNDIRQGLPREIELRQKQYEYYREKLLTF